MAHTAVDFPGEYRSKLVNTLATIDMNAVDRAIAILREARDNERHVFVCGNGGSASTASHFVCDMVKGASFNRESRFRIMGLTDSLPTITAYSNDVSYDCIFEEQMKNFAKKGDVLIAISGSGNSPNVVRATEYANSIGCHTIALTGRDGGKLGKAAELEIRIADQHMGRIEDGHLIVCHMMGYYFMDHEKRREA